MAVVKVQGHFVLVSGYFVVGVSISFGGLVFLWGGCLFEGWFLRRVLFLNGADYGGSQSSGSFHFGIRLFCGGVSISFGGMVFLWGGLFI